MARACRYVPLSKQPLVLVLGQVRISPVRKMENYLADIQEEFRRNGFPIERASTVQQIVIGPSGPSAVEQKLWEYRNREETWSILVFADSIVLQTTAYTRFEEFAGKLQMAVGAVLARTESDKLGVVHRLGLRYVDAILPRPGEDHRLYLREGLRGIADEAFQGGTHRLQLESVGRTLVADGQGTLVVRVTQNDKGLEVPPDLLGNHPRRTRRGKAGELVTLIDMDHFMAGNFEPKIDWVVDRAYKLHDHIIETFHDFIITDKAVEIWR
jgi:uncharacterized protein (TIGR04255 family)